LGQLDAAVLSLRECLRLAPGYGEAHWTLASLGRKDLASTHARELEQLLARASDDPHVAIPAAASLFRVHETLGEYDKAFSYLDTTKRRARQANGYDIRRDEEMFASIMETFDA